MPYMAYLPLLTCTTRVTTNSWMLACLRNKGAFRWPNSDQWWSLGQHGLSTTYKKTLSKAQVTESWVGCSWQSIYLNKIQKSCNKLILGSPKKVLFMVRLTVSGGFSGWTSASSAVTINKCGILTHFSTEIWFFDTQNTFHLFVRGLKNAYFMSLITLLYRYLTILWQSSSNQWGALMIGQLCLCYFLV